MQVYSFLCHYISYIIFEGHENYCLLVCQNVLDTVRAEQDGSKLLLNGRASHYALGGQNTNFKATPFLAPNFKATPFYQQGTPFLPEENVQD